MKLYLLFISLLYLLTGILVHVILAQLNINSSGLIAISTAALAFLAHLYMEGIIVTDDFEPKITFKDHLSDFKYCFFGGILVLIPSVFIVTGLSLLIKNSLIAGLVLIIIGGLIGLVGWRYSNA